MKSSPPTHRVPGFRSGAAARTALVCLAVAWAGALGGVLAQAPTDTTAGVPAPREGSIGRTAAGWSDVKALAAWIDAYAALPELEREQLGEPYRASVFAQVQLRTESDRLNPERQRYALRAEPRLPYLRRAERELQAAQRATLETLDAPARREAAAEALAIAFDVAAARRERARLDADAALHDSLATLTRARLAEPGFDVERVLDVEDDRSELLATRAALDGVLERRRLPPAVTRLVNADEALARAADLLALGVRPDERLATELALLDAEVAFERASNWKVIDFVQLDYRTDLERQERFSLGAGVNFPRARVRQLDELALERAEEIFDAQLEARDRQRALERDYEALLRTGDELAALRDAVAERRARRARLAATLRTSALTRPDDLLRIRRRDLRDAREVAEAEAEVLEAYAEMVGRSGWVDEEGLGRWVLR